METILWATKKGAEDWQEELISCSADAAHIQKARAWALANGFDRLRTSTFNGERPDFIGAINKRA